MISKGKVVTNVGKCNSPLFSSFVSYGVIGVAVAREIVALQGTDHPRDFPPNIGVYASWLDSLPDKQEVLGSSPRAPTNGYHLPPLNGRVMDKVTKKGASSPTYLLYWGLAQR